MGAVPKHKTSTHRKGKRRAGIKLDNKQIGLCPQCNQAKLPHQACKNCGYHHSKAQAK